MSDDDVLLLVRHGIAEDHHPDGDFSRRLTSAGRAVLERHARYLATRVRLTRVVASPAVRARDSAEILAHALGVKNVELRDELGSSTVSAAAIIAVANEIGAGAALVSHNPALTDAVTRILGRQARVGFNPGTAVALARSTGGGGWVLRFTHQPPPV